jgi:Tol biopolymer transport system component
MRRSVVLVALLAAACGGDDVTVPPGSGTLEISTTTTGVEIDPDGYTFRTDNADAEPIGSNDSNRSPQSVGSHAVELSGLSANCSVSGNNPQNIEVTADQTASVAFAVTCTSTTGSVSVSTSTTGDSPDADGYQVTLDGVDQGPLVTNASVTLSNVSPGTHLVGLGGVAGNCRVQGDNPQTVTIHAGAAAPAAFAITCQAPPAQSGTIQVITATSGTNNDPDGYAFSVDGGSSQPIAVNGKVSVSNTATGTHAIQLTGAAPNCTVQGTNPRSATVVNGATVEVRFAITCSATAGSLEIKTSTTGSNPDADGYSVSIEGGQGRVIGANATLTLSDIAPGSHQVTLAGIAPNCTVADDNPQGIKVNDGGTTAVTFNIECEGKILLNRDDDIFTLNGDGTDLRNLTSSPAHDLGPIWSPDGKKIAFWSDRDGGGNDIFVMNADGSGLVNLTRLPGDDALPSWSPDGSRIAFTHGGSEIFTMNSDGSNPADLGSGDEATWSPDGSKIGFTDNGRIYSMNADGTARTGLSQAGNWQDRGASWSPDGSLIGFTRLETDPNENVALNLWVMRRDGTQPRALTSFIPGPLFDQVVTGWSWSPDGHTIAYGAGQSISGGEIYSVGTDGTNRTLLSGAVELSATLPSWSPGSRILFVVTEPFASDLFVMDPDGSNVRNLTNSPALQGTGVWQP